MAATPTPNAAGGTDWDDGAGGKASTDATGELVSVSPNLMKPAAWLQTPVYIALGVGALVGIGVKMFMNKKRA